MVMSRSKETSARAVVREKAVCSVLLAISVLLRGLPVTSLSWAGGRYRRSDVQRDVAGGGHRWEKAAPFCLFIPY